MLITCVSRVFHVLLACVSSTTHLYFTCYSRLFHISLTCFSRITHVYFTYRKIDGFFSLGIPGLGICIVVVSIILLEYIGIIFFVKSVHVHLLFTFISCVSDFTSMCDLLSRKSDLQQLTNDSGAAYCVGSHPIVPFPSRLKS